MSARDAMTGALQRLLKAAGAEVIIRDRKYTKNLSLVPVHISAKISICNQYRVSSTAVMWCMICAFVANLPVTSGVRDAPAVVMTWSCMLCSRWTTCFQRRPRRTRARHASTR